MKIKFKIEIAFAITLTVLLLALCVNKFFDLKTQALQGLNDRNYSLLNDALGVYRGDNEGLCPDVLEDLVPFYIEKIPPVYNGKGKELIKVKNAKEATSFDKETAWIYVNDKTSEDYCRVFINKR